MMVGRLPSPSSSARNAVNSMSRASDDIRVEAQGLAREGQRGFDVVPIQGRSRHGDRPVDGLGPMTLPLLFHACEPQVAFEPGVVRRGIEVAGLVEQRLAAGERTALEFDPRVGEQRGCPLLCHSGRDLLLEGHRPGMCRFDLEHFLAGGERPLEFTVLEAGLATLQGPLNLRLLCPREGFSRGDGVGRRRQLGRASADRGRLRRTCRCRLRRTGSVIGVTMVCADEASKSDVCSIRRRTRLRAIRSDSASL